MRDIIKNLDEITDSREILEAKPHPFTTIFIYILIAILFSGFLWAWFGEKEILVKATGVIQPEEDTYKIASLVSGKVESINYINGKIVNEGDILLTINHDELDLQKESYENSIIDLENELANLNKFKESVNDGKDYFDKNSEIEKEYYEKYLNYKLSLEQSEDQLKQNKTQKSD
ncbi:biotin/lipoyl-binding protein, partial [Clostridium grantii]